MAKYYTLVTNVGKAKMANAQVTGDKVEFSKIALGSGGGSPKETQETLVDQKWKGNISNVSVDSDNPNWVVVEAVVPSGIGGFMINEVGLFDDEGDLIVVGNYPETYKPKGDEGTVKDIAIRIIIEVTNADSVTMKVDPSVVIATRKYVDEKVKQSSGEVDDAVNKITDGSITIESLDTEDKTLSGSINEVRDYAKTTKEDLEKELQSLQKRLGNLDDLSTDEKSSLVASINKVIKLIDEHQAEDATLMKKGHVQLSNATDSESESLAATPKAVKEAMDKADSAFTSASNGKQVVGNAITGVDPNVVVPTTPTYQDLADAISRIYTGPIFNAGDSIIASVPGSLSFPAGSRYIKRKEIKILSDSVRSVRVSVDARNNSQNGKTYIKVYINNESIGSEMSTGSAYFTTLTEDINVIKEDIVQIYAYSTTTTGGTLGIMSIAVDISDLGGALS